MKGCFLSSSRCGDWVNGGEGRWDRLKSGSRNPWWLNVSKYRAENPSGTQKAAVEIAWQNPGLGQIQDVFRSFDRTQPKTKFPQGKPCGAPCGKDGII
jgi:hypothetical protein